MGFIDKQLILSENQHINYVGVVDTKYWLADKYIDLGPGGTDPGVGAITTHYETQPGWHELSDKLYLHCCSAGTPGGTAPVSPGAVYLHISGAHSTSAVTTMDAWPGIGDDNYDYYISPIVYKEWWQIHYQRLVDVLLPRFYHRYLFIQYETSWDVDILLKTWIDNSDDFNSVRKGFIQHMNPLPTH